MKEKIINIFKNKYAIIVISLFFVTSIIANIYLLTKITIAPKITPVILNTATTSNTVIESPYGFRNEVVTIYDGKNTKTYSTTTPITESDLKEIRENIIYHHKMISEYFRKQDELFHSFWYSF